MENRPDKRLHELLHLLAGVLDLIGDILINLPIAIEIASLGDDDWTSQEALPALDRIRTELIKDEPMDADVQKLIAAMITEWMGGFELAALSRHAGPAPWRLDLMQDHLHRALILAAQAVKDLGIDLGIDLDIWDDEEPGEE